MRVRSFLLSGWLVSGLSAAVLLSGCGRKPAPEPSAEKKASRHEDEEHAHAKGIVTMGDYHAKLLVENGGSLKLFILGKDESKVAAIEAQEVAGYLKAEQDMEAVRITLKPDPQAGDPQGKTSQFTGSVPENLHGQPLIATFQLTIAGERYRPEFRTGEKNHAGHDGMPEGIARGEGVSDEERQHYLTPGGIYTTADIKANGDTIPSDKFKGMRWKHGKAKAGDKLCPVTDNKADPTCSWVVNGKKYEFCCPPCLDKFIDWAKNEPEQIKEPGMYVKK